MVLHTRKLSLSSSVMVHLHRQRLKQGVVPWEQREDGEGKEAAEKPNDDVAEAAAKAPESTPAKAGPSPKEPPQMKAAAGSAEEWEQWMEVCRVGVRQPLGTDCRKRCYWALGGRASAWRIYVEENDSSLWGWYEGAPP